MRGPFAALVAMCAVGLAVGLLVPRVTAAPPPAPPLTGPAERVPAPPDPWGPTTPEPGDPEEALLQERLGGLASLVLPADELVEACAQPAVALPEPAAGADEIADVIATTEILRGHELVDRVDVRLVDAEEMAAEIEERFAGRGDPERVGLEQRVLTALGAIEPGTDLAELRVNAFAEQVSGLHAGPDELVLLRVDDRAALDPLEQVVLAHEVEHALTFQHLGRPADHRGDGEHADARRASLAVVEGSATALMLQYARAVLGADERADLHAALLGRAREGALEGYTPYLLAELRFPYTAGLRFACSRWLEHGWKGVDATYTQPPASSAEILFPERYGDEPARPRALETLDAPWERARTTTFGAAELLWLLEAPGGDTTAALDAPRERAAAWDGGRLVAWTRGDDTAVGIALVERAAAEDRPTLCDTVQEWYAAAFPAAVPDTTGDVFVFDGEQQAAAMACDGEQVRLGIAPTSATAATLVR